MLTILEAVRGMRSPFWSPSWSPPNWLQQAAAEAQRRELEQAYERLRAELAVECERIGDALGRATVTFDSLVRCLGSTRRPRDQWEVRAAIRRERARIAFLRGGRLGADLRRVRPEVPRLAPARAPRAVLRVLGGRQSYARVRCDRKRAVSRAATTVRRGR